MRINDILRAPNGSLWCVGRVGLQLWPSSKWTYAIRSGISFSVVNWRMHRKVRWRRTIRPRSTRKAAIALEVGKSQTIVGADHRLRKCRYHQRQHQGLEELHSVCLMEKGRVRLLGTTIPTLIGHTHASTFSIGQRLQMP